MVYKNKKGYALITVIIITALMIILGTTLLNISFGESKQVIDEDNKLQAFYLARSGAETTLSAWENSDDDNKPIGDCKVYLNKGNVFTNVSTDAIGEFAVNVALDGAKTVITSTGTVKDVNKKVTVTIFPTTTEIEVPPPSLDTIDGHDESLGWYSYNSGQIDRSGNLPLYDGDKIVNIEAKNSLKIPNKKCPDATFQAKKMVFSSSIQVLHNSIIIRCNIVSINNSIDFSKQDGNANLKFEVLDGITREGKDGKWGIAYFKDKGGYYFKQSADGIIIENEDDIDNKMEKIQIGDPNYNNPFTGSKKNVTTYSILWS